MDKSPREANDPSEWINHQGKQMIQVNGLITKGSK